MATEEERWIVVDGRRWRRSDPAIPERLRTELVAELMAARRAVRAGAPDARSRVQDAKVALGERGAAWWDEPSDEQRRARIAAAVRVLLRHRPEGTVCPSEVARVVDGRDWRGWMPLVREVAAGLDGVRFLQGGQPVDPAQVRGPVRLGTEAAG